MPSFTNVIAKNTIYNALGKFWIIFSNLLIIPFIINNLGIELYGIWALSLMISSASLVFDLGLSSSIIKFTAQYFTSKNNNLLNGLISTSITVYIIIFSLLVGFGFIFMPLITIYILNIPDFLYNQAIYAFRLVLIAFFMGGLSNILVAILLGAQRMDITNKLIIATSTLQVVGVLLVLHWEFGLYGLIINLIFVQIIQLILLFKILHRINSEIKFNHFSFDKNIFKNLFSYSGKLQIINGTQFIIEQVTKIFIVNFSGLGGVSYFDIAMKVVGFIRLIPLLLLSALIPAVSKLDAQNENHKLIPLYIRGSKYILIVTIPIIIFIILFAPFIVEFFLKTQQEVLSYSIQLLAIVYGFNLLTGMGTTIARGIGKLNYETNYAILAAIMNIFLVYILGSYLGYGGIIIGISISVIFSSFYFLWKFQSFFNRNFGNLEGEPIKSTIKIITSALLIYFIFQIIYFNLYMVIGESISITLILFLIFIFFYFAVLIILKILDNNDLFFFKSILKFKSNNL